MNRIRRIIAAAVVMFASALTALAAAPAANASNWPHPGDGGPAGTHTTVRVITAGGMPGWQITLIVIGAALAAATVAVLIDCARAARKIHATTA
jgi:hypothetical protein